MAKILRPDAPVTVVRDRQGSGRSHLLNEVRAQLVPPTPLLWKLVLNVVAGDLVFER